MAHTSIRRFCHHQVPARKTKPRAPAYARGSVSCWVRAGMWCDDGLGVKQVWSRGSASKSCQTTPYTCPHADQLFLCDTSIAIGSK